jgi:membrane-bound lytic murein transglycosylase D
MVTRTITAALLCFILLAAGCSSEPVARVDAPPAEKTAESSDTAVTPELSAPSDPELAAALEEEEVQAVSDSAVLALLEIARQHYLSASNAVANGDSFRAALQFEQAINILNELSSVEEIETNRDFADLSRAVIEDYESYIARIDTLNPDASIFALREKLSQFVEEDTSTDDVGSTRVVGGTSIPIVWNHLVQQHIEFYKGRGRVHLERWIERSGRYFPTLLRILREEGAPEELVYLAMIESGLSPRARSWASAVGMWQFVKGTGKLYGLDATTWYDERREVEKSTRAAARHLLDLHEEFGDWHLALAAYNSGAGRVYRAIRRSGSTNYWAMHRHLPRETRNYVPTFTAVAIIMMNRREYGFDHVRPGEPLAFETVMVDECVDLDVLAGCAGTDGETLRDLNPELTRWCTPPGGLIYPLKVPVGSSERFHASFAQLPPEAKQNWIVHTVRKRESLSSIARRYGVSTSTLLAANDLPSARSIRRGMVLRIPVAKPTAAYAATGSPLEDVGPRRKASVDRARVEKVLAEGERRSAVVPRDRTRVVYTVKSGDTLGEIAEAYGVRAADIRNWNSLSYRRQILAGQKLKIYVRGDGTAYASAAPKKSATPGRTPQDPDRITYHQVRKGETLSGIAAANDVTVAQLQSWNNLRRTGIRAGQKLVVYTDARNVRLEKEDSSKPATAQIPPKSKGVTVYKVKRGDTLWSIAEVHQVQASDIRKWNKLKKNTIYEGQELRIHIGDVTTVLSN